MPVGERTTYTDTSNQIRAIDPLIDMIDWTDAALLRLLGLNGEKNKFRFRDWPRTFYELQEDTMSPRVSTAAAQWDAADTTNSVASGHGVYFKEGDVLKVDDELIYVSSVSGDVLTVIRGFAGTTDATHLIGSTVLLATIARLEGASYDLGHTTTLTQPNNYTQIISEAVQVTGSEMVMNKYGVADTMAYHLGKLMMDGTKAGKLPILLQQIFYYGQKAAGSGSTARAAGGFEEFVTTNVHNKSSAALTLKMIEDLQEELFLAGGTPDVMVVNTHQRRKISSFFEDPIRTTRTETTGGNIIKTIDTNFGDLEVVFDRWCPTDRLYMFEKDKVGWLTYRPFQIITREEADGFGQGDRWVKEILGEYGFMVRTQSAHGYLYNLSTTA